MPTDSQINSIIDTARLAPSVHNTQPWLARVEGSSLIVSVDPHHTLADGDPTGRQTVISLGIFTEAIAIGARQLGLKVVEAKLQDKEVIVSFGDGQPGTVSPEAVQLLRARSSDRSIYKPAAISPGLIGTIEQTASDGISVRVMTERGFIQVAANLTAKGIGLALSSPSFRQELSRYLVLPWSHKTRGISVKSLYINPVLAILQPLMMRFGIGTSAEAKLEKKRWESASAVVMICGQGDLQKYWLEAGRTYLRTSLAIQRAGLAQATSAAIVEASNYHEDIETLLGTHERILAMVRVGAGSPKKHLSPRISVTDILRS